MNARIVEGGHYCLRVIGASVTDDPHLPLLERLPQHRLNGVIQHAAPVVSRCNHRDKRCSGSSTIRHFPGLTESDWESSHYLTAADIYLDQHDHRGALAC